MNPAQIERVFGRGRLKMVTGEHVEVFREAVARGERRRYTKRFLSTREGDFGQWTEREWRILARLIGHGIACVPDVVQIDRGRLGGMQLVQTYDAGVTVDQWATLLPVARDGRVIRHVFEDCAHWWALAHHCLRALNEIHPLELVHLDIKGDNVCIPYAPADLEPDSSELWLRPVFAQLALIDFAFALISRESLTTPLPIGWQKEYDYQSPRLLAALEAGRDGDLQATRDLDWRCDMYSLAAMLDRYLPDERSASHAEPGAGWTPERYDAAKALIVCIRDSHDAELSRERPHRELLERTDATLRHEDLALSLERGWTLAREATASTASASPLTPVTRLVPITPLVTPIHVARSGRTTAVTVVAPQPSPAAEQVVTRLAPPRAEPLPPHRARSARAIAAVIVLVGLAVGAALSGLGERAPQPLRAALQSLGEPLRAAADRTQDTAVRLLDREGKAPDAGFAPSGPAAARVATNEASEVKHPPPAADPHARPAAAAPSSAASPIEMPGAGTAASSSPLAPSSVAKLPAPPHESLVASMPSTTRQAIASPQRASKPQRTAQVSAPPVSSRATPSRAPPAERRAHPSWAALEPPAWSGSSYRGEGPGEPPGAKTPATHAPTVALSSNAAATKSAVALSGDAAATKPAAAPQVQQVSAPIEERSDTLSLAFAQPASEARSRAAAEQRMEDEFALQGRRTLLENVPRVAKQAEPEIARVLAMAASAYRQSQERTVADAARTTRLRAETSLPAPMMPSGEARRLNDQARAAFASGRNVLDAFELQIRAFGANPQDPEIAGSLALLYLKLSPPQPDMARQIALVALVGRGAQFRATRVEDWNTFAVASALGGRDADAKNALYVMLALSGSVEPTCVAALNALANYGERLRGPVEALLYRVHAQGRSLDSPWCAWPPNGSTPPRAAWPGYSQSWR